MKRDEYVVKSKHYDKGEFVFREEGRSNMENVQSYIEVELECLRDLTTSDFSAMAFMESGEYRIRWKYASGNGNERYKQITLKPGSGLAGIVIRIGRPVMLDMNVPDAQSMRYEYPIMLTEHLEAVVAVPFMFDETQGVLLVGSRSMRTYSVHEIELIVSTAERLALLIKHKELQDHGL